MTQRIVPLVSGLLLVSSATASIAGAWLRPAGSRYVKISGSYLYSTREFDASGNKVAILSSQDDVTDTSFRDVTISTYLEYGVYPDLTVVAKVPFRILTSRRTEIADLANLRYNVEAVNGGLADLELAGRVPLLRAPFLISFQLGVKLPLGYPAQPSNGGAALGSGSADLEGRLMFGWSLHPFGYVGAEFGYRLRGGDIDDQMDVLLEGGSRWRRLFFGVKLGASFSAGEIETLTESSTKRVTNYDAIQIVPAASFDVTPAAAIVGEAFHTLNGKNTTAGTTWAVGIVLSR